MFFVHRFNPPLSKLGPAFSSADNLTVTSVSVARTRRGRENSKTARSTSWARLPKSITWEQNHVRYVMIYLKATDFEGWKNSRKRVQNCLICLVRRNCLFEFLGRALIARPFWLEMMIYPPLLRKNQYRTFPRSHTLHCNLAWLNAKTWSKNTSVLIMI